MQTLQQWLDRKPAGPKPKKRVRQVSKKRAREGKAYSLLRAAFLKAHPRCQAFETILWGASVGTTPSKDGWLENIAPPLATDIHHKAGRYDGNYLNTDTWLAVCRLSHRWIHANPKKARELGLLT